MMTIQVDAGCTELYSAQVPTDIDGDRGRVLLYLSNAGGKVKRRRVAKDLGITRLRLNRAADELPANLVGWSIDGELYWIGGER